MFWKPTSSKSASSRSTSEQNRFWSQNRIIRRAGKNCFQASSGAPGGRQHSQKSIKISINILCLFWIHLGRLPGGCWESNWSPNHHKSLHQLIRETQNALSKKEKHIGTQQENQFRKHNHRKGRKLKMLMFQLFVLTV